MARVKKIALIDQITTYGTRRQEIKKDLEPRYIFAEIQSVTRQEFFAASSKGMASDGMALVWPWEYHGEEIMEMEGKRYAIYRTFMPDNGKKLELYYQYEVGPANPAGGNEQ